MAKSANPKITKAKKPAPKKRAAGASSVRRKASAATTQETTATPQLNARQERFVQEYLIDLNATQAAIRAGYSEKTARQMGAENLTKPYIQAAIAEARAKQQERTGITADRVLQEVARLCFYDPRKLFNDDGSPLGIHELDDATAAVLAGLDVMEQFEGSGKDRTFVGYVKKYKLPDKGANLERLMKHLGLYERDNSQKTDPLTALLQTIATSNGSSFKPVAQDPEHREDED